MLFFLTFYSCGGLDQVPYVESILHSRNKSQLVVVYNPFNMLLSPVC